MSEPITLASLERDEEKIITTIKIEYNFYEKRNKELRSKLAEIRRARKHLLAGVSPITIRRAEKIITVSSGKLEGDDKHIVTRVIEDMVRNRGRSLVECYACTKNYDGYHHQSVGWMTFGYGPKHGNIAFRIDMTPRMRREKRDLNDAEIEDCLYLLNHVLEGKYVSKWDAKYKGYQL